MAEVVDRETAELEFNKWAAAMDLTAKLDPATLDDADRKEVATEKRRLVDAIMDGRLVVNDKGEFVFTPVTEERPQPILFSEPSGAALMAIDKAGERENVRKSFNVLAEITGQNVPRYARMKNRDLSVCTAILILFLAK